MQDDLNSLINAPTLVKLGEREVAITPIKVRELPAFTRAISPIFAALGQGLDVPTLLAAYPESVIEATAIGARLPIEEVRELDLDGLLALAFAVLEVNADFFARRIAPALEAGSTRLAKKLDGLNLSLASVAPG